MVVRSRTKSAVLRFVVVARDGNLAKAIRSQFEAAGGMPSVLREPSR